EARAVRRIEVTRERLAVAARRRQRVRADAVGAARAVDEHGELVAAAARGAQEAVAGAIRQRREIDFVPLRGAHPAALRENDRDGLARDELAFRDRLRRLALDDGRAALVAV